MRIIRAVALLLLLAALAVPAGTRVPCAGTAPPAACCCPRSDDGADGCGPSGCCCARDGAPVAPERPEPSTPAGPGAHESLVAPASLPATVPDAVADAASFAPVPSAVAAAAPALFLVLCSFRC